MDDIKKNVTTSQLSPKMSGSRWPEQMFSADFVREEEDYGLRQMKEICGETAGKGWRVY